MKQSRIRILTLLLGAVFCLFLLTGCGSEDSTSSNGSSEAGYPVTITTYDNDKQEVEVTFDKAPTKVLAVYQDSIETMLALGLEDKIVAAAGLDFDVLPDYQDAFSKVNYLTEFTPSKETVTSLEPDLIIGWTSLFGDKKLGSIKDWESQGVNCYNDLNSGAVSPKTLENEYTDIENMGKIFNVEDKAKALIDPMKSKVQQTVDYANQQGSKPTVMILESSDNKFSNYGSTTLGGDMVTQLGGTLTSPDASSLGEEDIIAADPDVIFVVYMQRENSNAAQDAVDAVMNNAAFADMKAVKNSRVIPIELAQMYCSGVRTNDGITTFATGMYPDLTLN